MKKILFSLFILFAVNSQAQFVYPTETVWDFLSGLQTNRINSSTSTRLGINVAPTQDFHVLADTVRFEGLDGTGGFLTIDANGVVNKGVAALTGLTPDQVLLGASDGSVLQTTHLYFDDLNDILYVDAVDSYLSLLGGTSSQIIMSGALNQYNIQNLANGDFYIENPSAMVGNPFIYTKASERIGLRQNTPLQDFHLLADTIRFEGLDGTGTYLGIDVNGDVTKTTVSAGLPSSSTVGQVFRVTGANTYAWGALDLGNASAITGTLPVSNGGTGITSFATGVATWLGTGTASDLRNLTTGTTGSGSLVFATSPTFATSVTGSYLTASELLITDGSKNIVSAPVATYPSLTELTYLKGVTSSIQTQLNAKGTGNVTKVGTPVDNQIGVWTGDGTIEGEASLTYDATAGFDLANSFDAQWSTAGAGTLITGNLSNAAATGKLIDLQHDEVTKFQVTYTGSTVIGKTSVDAVHALKSGQLGVGATGDVFQMANASGNTTTFTVDGKIDLYATEVPANGEILIGDGTDMELATLTAGEDITITNAAGSITIASTFNQDAGEYVPTASLVTNLDAVTFTNCQWHRTGSYVFGTANLTIDPTASGGIEFTFNIPIASNFAATTNALGGGLGNSTSTGTKGIITANVAGDVLQYNSSSNHTAAVTYTINWSYKIL